MCNMCLKLPYHDQTLANRLKSRRLIKEAGSVDESIIADWMEAGLGFRYTTRMVNQQRINEGRPIVGRSTAMNHFDHMQPLLTKLRSVAKATQ